jgi:cell shape-determining protein MreD
VVYLVKINLADFLATHPTQAVVVDCSTAAATLADYSILKVINNNNSSSNQFQFHRQVQTLLLPI